MLLCARSFKIQPEFGNTFVGVRQINDEELLERFQKLFVVHFRLCLNNGLSHTIFA